MSRTSASLSDFSPSVWITKSARATFSAAATLSRHDLVRAIVAEATGSEPSQLRRLRTRGDDDPVEVPRAAAFIQQGDFDNGDGVARPFEGAQIRLGWRDTRRDARSLRDRDARASGEHDGPSDGGRRSRQRQSHPAPNRAAMAAVASVPAAVTPCARSVAARQGMPARRNCSGA